MKLLTINLKRKIFETYNKERIMKLTHRIENKACVVTIGGNLALEETELVRKYLAPLSEEPTVNAVILNLEHVQFLDSDGIGWLAALFRTLQSRGKSLAVCHVNSRNLKVLTKIGFAEFVRICATESEAKRSVLEAQRS